MSVRRTAAVVLGVLTSHATMATAWARATSAQQVPARAEAARAAGDRLTLQQAAAAALRAHPSVALAHAGVEQAQAGRREAQASLLPALSLESGVTQFQEPMVVAPLHGFDPANPPVFDRTLTQTSLTLGYLAFDGGARTARVRRATSVRAGALAQLDQAEQALLAEVARRYAGVLVTRELLAAHASRVDALEQERARAARLLEQGRVARVAVLRAEAALSAARAEYAAATVRVDAAERELARLMGVDAGAVAGRALDAAEVVTAAPEREAALATALVTNPDLRRLALQVDAARAAVGVASAQWWPRVQLGGRFVQYGSSQGSAGGEWQTGVQLSYPVFTAGARPAAIDRARAEAVAGSAELALGRLRVAEGVDRALAAVEGAQARGAAWRSAVAQTEEVVRIERLALDTGAGVQTDWLAAQSELLRARASLTEARYDELVARVELARVMGELTMSWITNNVESGR
jgi:outer membrane protein